MSRKPNRNLPAKPGVTLTFTTYEFYTLKRNLPGPSGKLGGMQKMENYIIDNTDRYSFRCVLEEHLNSRLIRYIVKYGPGGPNERLRDACIPAYRRIGIDLHPLSKLSSLGKFVA